MSARAFLLGHLVLALSATAAWSSVRVVAPSGAPYTTIQAAVNAAVDGDVVLVHAGTYAGFNVLSKGIELVADPEGSVTINGSIEVNQVFAGKRLSMSGFHVQDGVVFVGNSAGSIRLEAITVLPGAPPPLWERVGLRVGQCTDVAILRCSLSGADAENLTPGSTPGPGLRLELNSNVAVYDSQMRGGRGSDAFTQGTHYYPPLRGGAGCQVQISGGAFFSGSSIEGGAGGDGLPGFTGQPGGVGLVVNPGSTAYALDNVIVGGPGGSGGAFPGAPTSGVVTDLPGTRRVLTCNTHLRESNSLTLGLQGEPGDLVWLNAGQTARWALDLPFAGVRLVGLGSRRLFLGTVPGSGFLTASLPFGDLGPFVQSRTFHLQGFFRDVGGASHHGSGAVVVLLDSAF